MPSDQTSSRQPHAPDPSEHGPGANTPPPVSDKYSILRLANSVRLQLMLFVLAAILASWIISSASSYYLVRQDALALRREMLARPDLYPNPIPEPRFRLVDFLLGPQQAVPRSAPPPGSPQPGNPAGSPQGPTNGPNGLFGSDPGPRIPEGMPPSPGNTGLGMPANPGGQPFAAASPGDRMRNPAMPPPPPSRVPMHWTRNVILRGVIALLLAVMTGLILGKRFTTPLLELARGARAYQAGAFKYRIRLHGQNEFTEVADAMNGMARQVSQQITRLEEDAARRRHLLADVAHELRGPTTTLRTMAGALEEGLADDPERRGRAIQSLARTSDRMLHLVTDLLELAKLDLHELPIHQQPVDARELAEASLLQHAARAKSAGVLLHPVERGASLMISADPDRLSQVLDNLLDNAISHAGRGAEVAITFTDDDPLRITVVDTGQGIPARHLPYIFDAFYRVDAARSPKDKHSGLGLRISRGLIEAHGGTLTLESREGQGTRAIISLPRSTDA